MAFKEKSFSELVSSLKPFGLRTFVKGNPNPYIDTKDNVVLYQNGEKALLKEKLS